MTFKLDSSLGSKLGAYNQSHYIEVAQEAIFMEQNIRFGLILGWLAILKKKIWADMSNFYGIEIEIWVGFGLVGNTEKNGQTMSYF